MAEFYFMITVLFIFSNFLYFSAIDIAKNKTEHVIMGVVYNALAITYLMQVNAYWANIFG